MNVRRSEPDSPLKARGPNEFSAPETSSTVASPNSGGIYPMLVDKNLTGRSEKRLPVMVPVRLSPFEAGSGEVEEKTYTDNLSSRGVRVCSIRSWRPEIN